MWSIGEPDISINPIQLGSDPVKQIAYSYDATDQLTGESATGGISGSAYSNAFQYDAMGNRLSSQHVQGSNTTTATSAANALNQWTSVAYQQNGTATGSAGLSYDPSGNLTRSLSSTGSQRLYFYDDLDRLIRIENKDASGTYLSKSEFVYDFASRKVISREFNWTNGQWSQTSETRRVASLMAST